VIWKTKSERRYWGDEYHPANIGRRAAELYQASAAPGSICVEFGFASVQSSLKFWNGTRVHLTIIALMNIHGGKSQRAEQLIRVITELPEIRSRLTFENDEYAYSASEILEVCKRSGSNGVRCPSSYLPWRTNQLWASECSWDVLCARETWSNPDWQLVHISNGQQAQWQTAQWLDHRYAECLSGSSLIEIEAKAKEQAIARLQAEWLVADWIYCTRLFMYPVSAIRCTTMIRTSNPAVELPKVVDPILLKAAQNLSYLLWSKSEHG